MLVHELFRPLGNDPSRPGVVVWQLSCGERIRMKYHPSLEPGLEIQVKDTSPKRTKCEECFGHDANRVRENEDGDVEPSVDEELSAPFDDTLGDYQQIDDEVLKEESDEYGP